VKCHFCDQGAIKLCDKPVIKRGSHIDPNDVTCDLPVCDLHAEKQTTVFINAGRDSYVDSLDYCPFHSGERKRNFIQPVKD
jgi:hypothetical protein